MAPGQWQRCQGIVLAVAFLSVAHVAYSSGRLMASTPGMLMGDAPMLSTAEQIVRRSYMQTFGALPTARVCDPSVGGKACSESLLAEAMQLSSHETRPHHFPWWFITMLRDWNTNGIGVHSGWHNLSTSVPSMDFCTIEKIATTQWRNVQCFLNEGIEPRLAPRPCHLNATRLERREHGPARVVMLRDPLERLLSGYMNKCVHRLRRRIEGHCEPNVVFNGSSLTKQIRADPKQLFAAYVDGFPLKWNIHFFPLSVYCDGLFRHIGDYDFVGKMDNNFYRDLAKLNSKLGKGNKLPVALEKVFHLSDELVVHKDSNVGKETRAPSHVKEYYTAASVRRALQYFAVDYLRLGLKIPSWAHEILAEESAAFTIT